MNSVNTRVLYTRRPSLFCHIQQHDALRTPGAHPNGARRAERRRRPANPRPAPWRTKEEAKQKYEKPNMDATEILSLSVFSCTHGNVLRHKERFRAPGWKWRSITSATFIVVIGCALFPTSALAQLSIQALFLSWYSIIIVAQ